jgi:hypothetical protein
LILAPDLVPIQIWALVIPTLTQIRMKAFGMIGWVVMVVAGVWGVVD